MRGLIRSGILAVAAAFLAGACSSAGATPAPSAAPTSAAPTSALAPSVAATSALATSVPTSSAGGECQAANLKLVTPGTMTIATGNPAFPPWFGGDPPSGSSWQVSDPASGKGFESAVAYAISKKLGFTNDHIAWVAVDFNNAIQPGAKNFDMFLSEVSWTAERAQAVDLSDGYFEDNQAVVALKGTPIADVKSVAALKKYKLGAAVATTSLGYITDNIKPAAKAAVYNDNDGALAALKAKQIDGIVVDLGTAFYMTSAQLDNGVIVGALPKVGAGEHFSVLLTKGSSLTGCVNQVIATLSSDGTLAMIRDVWIASAGNAPQLGP